MLIAEKPVKAPVDGDDRKPFRSLVEARQKHLSVLRERSSAGTGHTVGTARELTRRLQATGTVVWDEKERSILQGLLDYWSGFLDREGVHEGACLIADFDFNAAPELPEDACPYLGLEAFQVSDSKLFFGRELLVEDIATRLRRDRFVAVVGASGSGKSSIVRAGLLPYLNSVNEWWTLDPIVPGSEPLGSLADAFGISDKLAFATECKRDSEYLNKTLNKLGSKPAILIVDQFEELFTLCRSEDDQLAFLKNLRAAVTSDNSNHRVVVTIREDCTNFVARDDDLHRLFDKSQVRLGPLGAQALSQVIRRPAELVGLRFEEGIVEDLISQVLGDPAALPLLQFTLFELWNKRSRNVITGQAYKQLGRVRDALGRRADEIYGSMLLEDQDAAKHLFVRLARFSETLEVTSRRVAMSELVRIYPGRIPAVVEKFVAARLLKREERKRENRHNCVTVEVAHEALIRNWPRLVQWLEDARTTTREGIRLADAAAYWNSLNRDSAALLRGPPLSEAQAYAKERWDLSDLERSFLKASCEFEKASERRQKLFKIVRNGIFGAGAAIVIGILVWLVLLSNKQRNFVRHAHNVAVQEDTRNYPRSILLLLASMQKPNTLLIPFFPDTDARSDLIKMLTRSPVFGEMAAAVGISKDGSKLVLLSEKNRVDVLDLHKGGGYLREERGLPKPALEYVGELPPASRPQDFGFISVGYVTGLGPVVYRGGSLVFWSSDHHPTSIPVIERLPDDVKAKAGRQLPWVDFVDDHVKVTIPEFRTENPEYTIVLLGSEHLRSQDINAKPPTITIQLQGDRISPVFSHDGKYAYLERDAHYRLIALVVGSLESPTSVPTRIQLQSDATGNFVPSIGFARNSAQVIVRDSPDTLRAAEVTTGGLKAFQVPPELHSFAPSPTGFLRPPLAAIRREDSLLFAWPDQAEAARIQISELKDGDLKDWGSWLSGLDGVSQLSFDDTGRFLTALQNPWGGRARVRVWDLKRGDLLKDLNDEQLQNESCRTAATQGILNAFFRSDDLERGLRGETFQPCANRLLRPPKADSLLKPISEP